VLAPDVKLTEEELRRVGLHFDIADMPIRLGIDDPDFAVRTSTTTM